MTATPRKIAFIGLGIMGGPMAANLVKAGHTVTGYNRSRPAVDKLIAAGGHGADGIAQAVRDAEVVITMVPADPQVKEVVLGEGGVLAHAAPGTLLIDMSSITPQTSLEVEAAARDKGIRTLDAPVSGGEAGAVEAVLSIMVGGEADHFAEAKPVFEALGTTIVHVGPHGAGQTVKAANQLMVAVHLQALAEAVVFLENAGVDLAAALEVLGGGLAGSTVLARKRDAVLSRSFHHILARHVEGASHMAEGYTRAKAGNIGVCIGTSGPAGTDMITGLYSAIADSIPILCITGQAPRARLLQGRLPGRRHRVDRQARDQVGGHRARAGAGAARVPAGVPPHALGPARPGADRPAARRADGRDRVRRSTPTSRCRSTSRPPRASRSRRRSTCSTPPSGR
jgi:2-hydroxy-3-oxopropionate reductase